jgi:hypothetical protein
MSSAGKLAVVTVSGGLASVAGGGKFGNGAITAAFGYLYNELGNNHERGYEIDSKQPSFGSCLKNCTIEHYGLDDVFGDGFDDIAGRAGVAAGSVPISKQSIGVRVYPGTSPYTNSTSALGYRLYQTNPALDPRMPFRFMGTARLFGMVGRGLPFVGAGIAAYDAASIGYCTYACQSRRP